jgi:hypothetical protein
MKRRPLILLSLLLSGAFAQPAENWTPPVAAKKGKLKVADYQARLAGDVLVIRVTHEAGWHTYALDNLARAKKKAGEPPLGIEKDTQLAVSGGLKVVGKWRQTAPKDLSQPDINWWTWGFEGVSYFAVKVKRISGAEAVITINGQGCQATTCVMIDDLELRLPLDLSGNSSVSFPLETLFEAGDLSALP